MYELIVIFCIVGTPDCAEVRTITDNCVDTLRDVIREVKPTPKTEIRSLSCRRFKSTENPDNTENT